MSLLSAIIGGVARVPLADAVIRAAAAGLFGRAEGNEQGAGPFLALCGALTQRSIRDNQKKSAVSSACSLMCDNARVWQCAARGCIALQ